MTKTTALHALALASLALTTACSGADDVTRPHPDPGCEFDVSGASEKNGPCEPCEDLGDSNSREKNKPCIPEKPVERSGS
jgi:hypothetical protein